MEIHGYEDFEVIGSGGNAHVYKATSVASGEVVAVKVLRGGGDEAVARRFERERSLMAQLETITNVVPIHESGFAETGDPYLVMPLYTGGSLDDRIKAGPMPWFDAVDLARMLTESIALAHAKRILHLDVKPANVLLDDEGEPWLSDFGIAELMGHTASMSAQMMTPAFTPPERLDGEKPGEQTDLYGLVATLYALLSARPPYVTPEMTGPMAVMRSIMRDPLSLDVLPDSTPERVRNLLLRGLSKEPADRPRSAIELVGLLEDALDGRDIAPPATSVAVTGEMSGVPPAEGDASSTIVRAEPVSQDLLPAIPVPGSKRRQAVLAAVVLFLVVSVGAAAAVLLAGGDEDGESATATSPDAESTGGDVAPVDDELRDESDPTIDTDGEDPPSAGAVGVPDDGDDDGDEDGAGEEPAADTSTENTQAVLSASVQAPTPTAIPTTTTTTNSAGSDTRAQSTTTSSSTTTATAIPQTEATPQIEAGFVAAGGSTGSEQTVSFRSITVGAATSFSWDFGDGKSGSGERETHTYALPGTYSVTLIARGGGVSDSATHSVRVDANTPDLEAGFRASAGPAGSEQTISFTNITIGEASSFRWDFGDGSTSTERSPTHTYASSGTFSVTVTATGPAGSDSTTHSVRVDPNTTEFEAGWTASAKPAPNQQTLNFRSITIGDADSFSWDFGDGTTGVGETIVHTFPAAGTYVVTLTASGPGGSGTATHSVFVDANS